MLLSALGNARRSVTQQDLEKYMKYKRDMERKMGMDELKTQAPVVGLHAEERNNRGSHAPAPTAPSSSSAAPRPTAPAPVSSAAPRDFAAAAEDDDDDIYED